MKISRSLIVGLLIGFVAGGAVTSIFVLNPGADSQTANAGGRPGPGGGRGGQPGRGGFAPTVSMVTAEAAAIAKTIDVLGEARALQSVAITSEVTGLVKIVNVAPGKRMKEGGILLQIEDEEQKIALTRIRAQYPIAKSNADRYRQLADENAGSALEAEDAFNALKTLEAELRSAEFALEQRTIKAPFDGIAGITTIEPGDYLRAGDVVTTLDNTSSVVIEFSVPQEVAAFVALGQSVTARITSDAAHSFEGVVSAIDSRVDSASRTLRVEATVDNSQGLLLPGAVFAVSTVSEGAAAVSVPGLAVQWDRAGAYVWKRDGDGNAVRTSVIILQRNDDIVLVDGDLSAGDVLAADGADRVRAGVPLPAPGGPRSSSGGADAAAAEQ